MSLSAEAQHVINSLEAHFAAVKAAVADGSDELVSHVEKAWDDVLAAVHAFAGFQDTPAQPTEATTSVGAGPADEPHPT